MTTKTTLIAFCDGSYKKVKSVTWKHSQWIHWELPDGSTVSANPRNVNYLHIDIDRHAETQPKVTDETPE